MNLCIKTEPITVGADYNHIWLAGQISVCNGTRTVQYTVASAPAVKGSRFFYILRFKLQYLVGIVRGVNSLYIYYTKYMTKNES